MDKYKTVMKYCNEPECKSEQPHSHDDGVGGLDCDGPCGPRRVAAWKASCKLK